MTIDSDDVPKLAEKDAKHLTWPALLGIVHAFQGPGELLCRFLLRTLEVCPRCAKNCTAFREVIASGELQPAQLNLLALALAHSRGQTRSLRERMQAADLQWIRKRLAKEPPSWAIVEFLVRRSVAAVDPATAEAFADLAFQIALKAPRLAERVADGFDPFPEDCDEVPLPLHCAEEALSLAAAARGHVHHARGQGGQARDDFELMAVSIEEADPRPTAFLAPALVLQALSHLRDCNPALAWDWLESALSFQNNAHAPWKDLSLWIRIYQLRVLLCIDPTDSTNDRDELPTPHPVIVARELLAAHPPQELSNPPLALALLHACADTFLDLPSLTELQPLLEALGGLSDTNDARARLLGLTGRRAVLLGDHSQALQCCGQALDLWRQSGVPSRLVSACLDLSLARLAAGQAEDLPELFREAIRVAGGLGLEVLSLLTRLERDPALLPELAAPLRRQLHVLHTLGEPQAVFAEAPQIRGNGSPDQTAPPPPLTPLEIGTLACYFSPDDSWNRSAEALRHLLALDSIELPASMDRFFCPPDLYMLGTRWEVSQCWPGLVGLPDLPARIRGLEGPILWGVAEILLSESIRLSAEHQADPGLKLATLAADVAERLPLVPPWISEHYSADAQLLARWAKAHAHLCNNDLGAAGNLVAEASRNHTKILPVLVAAKYAMVTSGPHAALAHLAEQPRLRHHPLLRLYRSAALLSERQPDTAGALADVAEALSLNPETYARGVALRLRADLLTRTPQDREADARQALRELQEAQPDIALWFQARLDADPALFHRAYHVHRSHQARPHQAATIAAEHALCLHQAGDSARLADLVEAVTNHLKGAVPDELLHAFQLLASPQHTAAVGTRLLELARSRHYRAFFLELSAGPVRIASE